MDLKILLDKLDSIEYPIGLGGCRAKKLNYECCDYNIIIFDQKDIPDSVMQIDDEFVRLHHADLNESRVEILGQYQNLEIISDPKWELKIFLSKIKEKKESILQLRRINLSHITKINNLKGIALDRAL